MGNKHKYLNCKGEADEDGGRDGQAYCCKRAIDRFGDPSRGESCRHRIMVSYQRQDTPIVHFWCLLTPL